MPTDYFIARYLDDGSSDPEFGDGGVLRIPLSNGQPGKVEIVFVDRSGNVILAAAARTAQQASVALIRCDTAGAPVASFGNGGVLLTPFFGGLPNATITAIALDPFVEEIADSHTQSGGTAAAPSAEANADPKALAQLLPRAMGPVALAGARLVAAGAVGRRGRTPTFGVARYLLTGDPDETFSGDGRMLVPLPRERGIASAPALGVDGARRIIVAGEMTGFLPRTRTAGVARIRTDGGVDETFAAGLLDVVFNSEEMTGDLEVTDLLLNRRGEVFASAWGSRDRSLTRDSFLAVKITNTGRMDSTFGGDGVAETRFDTLARPHGVCGDARTRVMLLGEAGSGMLLTRHLATGTRDARFGEAGRVAIDISASQDVARAALVDSRERIVVVGSAGRVVGLARLEEDGRLDPGFGTGGMVRTEFARADFAVAEAVALDSQNRIVVGGLVGTNDVD